MSDAKRKKLVYGVEYRGETRDSTIGAPNSKTGKQSKDVIIKAFHTSKEREAWIAADNRRDVVKSTDIRKLTSGLSLQQHKDIMAMIDNIDPVSKNADECKQCEHCSCS